MRILAILFVLLIALPARAVTFEKGELSVVTASGQNFRFDVEIARSPAQQEQGLMFRKSLPGDAGMIFLKDRDEVATFWMKNCFIPLDMLFLTADGKVARIAPDVPPLFDKQPGPTDLVSSGGPVRAVLELNGGTAAKLGIHPGDRVVFPGLGAGKP